jgi:hypothetical protein
MWVHQSDFRGTATAMPVIFSVALDSHCEERSDETNPVIVEQRRWFWIASLRSQ